MALDALAGMLAKDWNRIIWKEGCYDPTTVMIGTYAKLEQSCKDDGTNLFVGYNTILSMLSLEDFLGACAVTMEGFCGPPSTLTIPHDDNRRG
jgi:hypothetical protein